MKLIKNIGGDCMRKDRILLVIALSVLIFQLIGIAGLSRIDNQLNNEEKISLDIDINVSPKQISQKSPSPTPERKIVTSKTVEKKHMKNGLSVGESANPVKQKQPRLS